MTPPSPFLEVCFSVSFLWLGSWIRLSGVFFRRKMYFYVFFYLGFVAGLGCFYWLVSRLFGLGGGLGLVLVFDVLVDDV